MRKYLTQIVSDNLRHSPSNDTIRNAFADGITNLYDAVELTQLELFYGDWADNAFAEIYVDTGSDDDCHDNIILRVV